MVSINHLPGVQTVKNLYHLGAAVLAAAANGYPAKDLQVIGVTGTDGKTTTSTLVYQILKHSGLKVALISTVGAYIGEDQIDTGFHVTSPASWPLQKLILNIKNQHYQYLVLESTSHGFDQHRLYATNIRYAIITNITHEHLDYHKTYDKYLNAKAKILTNARVAILNPEDESFALLQTRLKPGTKLITLKEHKLPARIVKAIDQKFTQKYNRQNATQAALLALELKVTAETIAAAIGNFTGVPGRMEQVPNKSGLKLIVDFAHTPNALEKALTTLQPEAPHKLIAVFGCAGLRDRGKRPMMGDIGSRLADEVIFTAEDPRTENLWNIIDQMTAGVKENRGHVHKIPDRQQAINFAVKLAKPGDTVVVCGKGHEQSMCFGKIELPWSDKAALITAIKENGKQ